MVDFAGYDLPVQFHGIIPEHQRVRTTVGVFDVSHMGRIEVRGEDAMAWINWMVTGDVTKLAVNQALYSAMCYADGGIVDDLVIYRLADHWLLVVNGANNAKDTAWLQEHVTGDVKLVNVTDEMAQLAIQGPKAEEAMQKIASIPLADIGFYWCAPGEIAGIKTLISRTGYTGEDGFEFYFPTKDADRMWDAIFAAGKEFDIEPIGLGARDTLRMEMKMALYGNDIDQTTNPIEAGLGWIVALDKPAGFIGSDVVKKVDADKPARRLVCLVLADKAIARPHYPIMAAGRAIGHVTSGTQSPSLGKGIAIGYVERAFAKFGTEVSIDIRGRGAAAVVVKPPFYKLGSRK